IDKASHNLLGHRDQHSLINFKVLAVTCPASGQGTINRQWQKSSTTKQSGLTPTFYFTRWGLASMTVSLKKVLASHRSGKLPLCGDWQ
ncbi:MAG: hypothetical protein VX683_07025, partial [Cyanobacteriota bacterium]|nr:hypothetical protein [Cyanobacteriota bacterium]